MVVGADEDFPVTVVDESVVESTQEDEVVHVGGATVGPVPDVMAFGPGGGFAAAGERATVIAGGQRTFLFRGDGARGAGEVQWVAVLVHDDGGEKTIAGELARGVAGERAHPRQPPDRRAVAEQVPIRTAILARSGSAVGLEFIRRVPLGRVGSYWVGVDRVAGVDVHRVGWIGVVGFCCCAGGFVVGDVVAVLTAQALEVLQPDVQVDVRSFAAFGGAILGSKVVVEDLPECLGAAPCGTAFVGGAVGCGPGFGQR
ncbi:hypothetical protein RhoFasGS6_04802 [Rhodococcus fascians]|nr:hypothetical protein [Rhodococcus fascians]